MPLHFRSVGKILAVLVCVLIVTSVPAQITFADSPQETAVARSLFEEGVKFADQGDWASALDRFTRAYALRPSSAIAFNLASAEIESGKLVAAAEHLRAITRDPSASSALKNEAEKKLAEITPRMAYLTVDVSGAGPDNEVHVDANKLPREAWSVSVPMDPGPHEVSFRRGDEVITTNQVMLAEGARERVSLVAVAPVVQPSKSPEPPPPPPIKPVETGETNQKKPLYKNWVVWTAVGAVVVAGAVTTFLLTQDKDPGTEEPVGGNTGKPIWEF